MAKPLTNAEKKAIKDFLKDKKHDKNKVDALVIDTDDDLIAAMQQLHNVTPAQYAKGKA